MTRTDNEFSFGKSLPFLPNCPKDNWTVDDALKGVSIIGGTGSGKTSASGKQLALAYLKEGWGGLVLCAKTDEAKLWQEYCNRKDVNRGQDLIIFGKGSKLDTDNGLDMIFNPIDYEMKRKGEGAGDTQNLTNIFMNIYRLSNRMIGADETKDERYWDAALKRCLNRVIELIKLAKHDLTYLNMVRVISTSETAHDIALYDALATLKEHSQNPSDNKLIAAKEKTDLKLADPSNFCLKCLVDACYETLMGESETSEEKDSKVYHYELVRDYFTRDIPRMDDKTRSIVFESFLGLAEPFLSGILHRHFSGATNLYPELTFTDKKVIVLNFPIKEYLDAGIISQSIFKLLFQQAIERRDVKAYPTPVFLWCDEAQYFITPYDQVFLTTARSSRTATVFLSQNLPNYHAKMGKGEDAKAQVDSLMGNLSTKIFHANSDTVTNNYASNLIGKAILPLKNIGEQKSTFNFGTTNSENLSFQFLPQIQPRAFTIFRTGGELNEYKVDGVLMATGRKWSDGNNFLTLTFTQDFTNPK